MIIKLGSRKFELGEGGVVRANDLHEECFHVINLDGEIEFYYGDKRLGTIKILNLDGKAIEMTPPPPPPCETCGRPFDVKE